MAMDLAMHDVGHPAQSGLAAPSMTIEELVMALRDPTRRFGRSAPEGLLAEYEQGDWSRVPAEVKEILESHAASPDVVFSVLDSAARFLSTHGLRLHGNPWLHMLCFEGVAGISYVVHLDLEREDANTWNRRFQSMLSSGDLLNDVFFLNFRHRGPVRAGDDSPA